MTVGAMYPGTFDPITLGHEDLDLGALEVRNVDDAPIDACRAQIAGDVIAAHHV